MTVEVAISGIGLSKFGRQPDVTGREMALSAIHTALDDADLSWPDVQVAFGGSDGSGLADTLVADLGLTGIPFTNVKNGCATGGSALMGAINAIRSGQADVALAVGFDKHPRGAFDPKPEDWGLPSGYGDAGLMLTTQFFGIKIARYMKTWGITDRALAEVAAKAYKNGALNSNAWRREELSVEEILNADMISDPLTKFMFCAPGEGGSAIILTRAGMSNQPTREVKLLAAEMRTRRFGSFEVFSPSIQGTGDPVSVSRDAAQAAFATAGIRPAEVDVLQLQDTESGAEIMHMAECGFVADGEQEDLIVSGETRVDGSMPINTDGGCIANGEPIGASGLRQVHEIVTQLRGEADGRQVSNPKIGFTHVYGAPGVSACTVLAV